MKREDSPESAAARRARHFSELCELGEEARRAGLARLAEEDPALAADVERMLALDMESRGPIEALREGVDDAAERRLLARDALAEAERPERLGAWRLGEKLGAGGMGEVWAAERIEGGFTQRSAVKIVRSGMASREILARFAIERQLLAQLQHPSIARLYDGGVAADGRPWFAMERVDGVPITRFAEEQRLDLAERLRLFLVVTAAVEFAHRNLVVHRDLKPSNILVTAEGEPKLLDFGLAKLLQEEVDPSRTRTELRALTPAYASPEQILGEPVTTSVDIYALGVILYELLTGELPHRRDRLSMEALAGELAHESVERPSARLRRAAESSHGTRRFRRLEGDLDTIALRALAREPARRYASVAAFADDLRRFLDGRPVLARPDSVRYRATKFVLRHRWGVISAALILASLVAGLAAATIQGRAARREANRATRVQEFLVRLFEGSDPANTEGEPVSARQLLEEGTRRIEAELDDEPDVQVALYSALSRIHRKLGAHEVGERLARSAIAIAEGPLDDPGAAAMARLALAEILGARFDFQGSRREIEAILPRLVADHGEDSDPVIRAKSQLSGALPQTGGNLDEALKLAREVYDFDRRSYGDEHPEAARSLALVGILLRYLDRNEEAEAAFRGSVATLERLYGAENPETAEVRSHHASVLEILGRDEEAIAEMLRSLAALEKSLGPRHPLVARTQVRVASLYSRRDRRADAEVLLRQCADSMRDSGSREEGDCLRMLGRILTEIPGRGDEAEASLARAVELLSTGDAQDPFLLNAMAALGRAKSRLGKHADGAILLRDAIARIETINGAESDLVRQPLLWLGEAELGSGDMMGAVATLRRAVAVSEKHRGADTLITARAIEPLVEALAAAGGEANRAEAVRLAARALAIYRSSGRVPERVAALEALSATLQRER